MGVKDGLEALVLTIVFSIVFVIIGMIYFGITLWIIKIATNLFFGPGLDTNWAVISAAILSVGAMLSGGRR